MYTTRAEREAYFHKLGQQEASSLLWKAHYNLKISDESIINRLKDLNITDWNFEDNDGHFPLMLALDRPDLLRYLLSFPTTNVNYQNELGETPLMMMVDDATGFDILMEHGANPDLLDENGETALFWAAKSTKTDSIATFHKLIRIPNVNLNHVNEDGDSVFHILARFSGNVASLYKARDLFQIAESTGMSYTLSILDAKGRTPLQRMSTSVSSKDMRALFLKYGASTGGKRRLLLSKRPEHRRTKFASRRQTRRRRNQRHTLRRHR